MLIRHAASRYVFEEIAYSAASVKNILHNLAKVLELLHFVLVV
jgi:hypothetical protein